jgi:hypothetical protein
MPKEKEKNLFIIAMGWIAYLADLLTLGQFVFSGNLKYFWTTQWFLGIFFILGLYFIGWGLHSLGGSIRADSIRYTFGVGYMIASLLIYINYCSLQTTNGLAIADYLGFLSLFVITLVTATLNLKVGHLLLPSYGYAMSSLIFAFTLIYKYIFTGKSFYWSIFIGELILLLIGAYLFSGLYQVYSKKNPNLELIDSIFQDSMEKTRKSNR